MGLLFLLMALRILFSITSICVFVLYPYLKIEQQTQKNKQTLDTFDGWWISDGVRARLTQSSHSYQEKEANQAVY